MQEGRARNQKAGVLVSTSAEALDFKTKGRVPSDGTLQVWGGGRFAGAADATVKSPRVSLLLQSSSRLPTLPRPLSALRMHLLFGSGPRNAGARLWAGPWFPFALCPLASCLTFFQRLLLCLFFLVAFPSWDFSCFFLLVCGTSPLPRALSSWPSGGRQGPEAGVFTVGRDLMLLWEWPEGLSS